MRCNRTAVLLCLLVLVSCADRRGGLRTGDADRIVTHRVGYGETWETIAEEFYGDIERAAELAIFNGRDPMERPKAGSGVRVPLSKNELKSLRKKLDAVSAYNEGLDLASKGDYGEAVERFREALGIDPLFMDASFNLAVTYQKLGLHKNAATVMKDLALRSPDNPGYLFALGHSLYHTGDLNGARKVFSDVLAIDPNHLKSLFSLAVVCEKLGKDEEAKRWWTEYLELDPDGEWSEEARSHLDSLLRSERR